MVRHCLAAALCAALACAGPAAAFDVKGSAIVTESEIQSGKGALQGNYGTFTLNWRRDATIGATFDKTKATPATAGKITNFSGSETYRRIDKIDDLSCEGGGKNTAIITVDRSFQTGAGPSTRAMVTIDRVGDPGPSGRLRVYLEVERIGAPTKARERSQRTGISECDVPKPDEPAKLTEPNANTGFGGRRILLGELKPPFGRSQTLNVKRALTPAELGRGDGVRAGQVEVALTVTNLPQAKANVSPQTVVRANAATFDPSGSTGNIVEALWSVKPAEDCTRVDGIPGVGPNPVEEIGGRLDIFEGNKLQKTEATMLCGLKTELTVEDSVFWDTAKADVAVTPRKDWATVMKPDKTPEQMGVTNPSLLFPDDGAIGINISAGCIAGGQRKRGCVGENYVGFESAGNQAVPGKIFDMGMVPLSGDGGGAGEDVQDEAYKELRKQFQDQLKKPNLSAEERASIRDALAQLEANAPKPGASNDDGGGLDYQTVGKAGPFSVHFYVVKPKIEIERVPAVNPLWSPGRKFYLANTSRGVTPATLTRLLSCVRKHEQLHSEWFRKSLEKKGFKSSGGKAYDPAPDLEVIFDHDPQKLVSRVTAAIREASTRLSESMAAGNASESHVFIRGRLMADPQCAQGGQIVLPEGTMKTVPDFASIGTD